ncbi:MAG: YbhB/YbcL family Raf kinase inhibitor-like protein [Clostridia bacterium]|nr:YbhB/YbcL family Raf kinase inhibitor-like protein [Clostridia bacterium]
MKRILIVFMALILCVGAMTSCSTPSSESEAPTLQPETEEPAAVPATEEPTAEPDIDEPTAVPATEEPTAEPVTAEPTAMPAMEVSSSAIADGVLSDEYGMRGSQLSNGIPTLSPPLTVSYIPEGTVALAVTVIDPDGGDWVHWLCCFEIDGENTVELPKDASITEAATLTQGRNDFGTIGYGGPTPPSGVHRYVFTVYALSEIPKLEEGFDLNALTTQLAISGTVLSEATVTGTYAH